MTMTDQGEAVLAHAVAAYEKALGPRLVACYALGSLAGPRNLKHRARSWARGRLGRDDALDEIRAPALLVARGPRRLTKIVLFPVRFLFTAETGRVGTNSLAAEHYLARADAPAAELVTAALGWRQRPPADPGAAAVLVGPELIPPYLYYIDDHVARLTAAGRDALAGRFRRWRARLVA